MDDTHILDEAGYLLVGDEDRPAMNRLCGWDTGPCASWAEAGLALDQHIEAAA